MTEHIKTLDDCDIIEISGTSYWRFKRGKTIAVAADEVGLSRETVREIENAILHAVETGKTARLDTKTIEAAREMLAKRKQNDLFVRDDLPLITLAFTDKELPIMEAATASLAVALWANVPASSKIGKDIWQDYPAACKTLDALAQRALRFPTKAQEVLISPDIIDEFRDACLNLSMWYLTHPLLLNKDREHALAQWPILRRVADALNLKKKQADTAPA